MRDMKYLNNINSPKDVRALDKWQLDDLAQEIREVLVETVSKNGGHLASNLGVVELTIAMHRVFDSPKDAFVWDVGHQVYTHKLLTGRYSRFDTLRRQDGLSGFSRPCESEHDLFYSGHSSTSISAGYGVAAAKKIKDDKRYTVAVVGDGSLTGGMVYEALNNAGRSRSRLIVILNDNKMSISQNVGSIAKYLAVIRSKKRYIRLKAGTEKLLNHIPFIGKRLSSAIFKLKTHVKNLIYKSTMFEDMGFRYMGPVDGHNINMLCETLETAKDVRKPVLLHVSTIKGKGYDFAEQSPSLFHGISDFDIHTGEPKNSSKTYNDEFGEFICNAAQKDKRICAITAAMAIGTGLGEFSDMYPSRFFDVGIAEEHAVTFASGLSKGGMIPIFAVYSTFLQRSFDQIIHDISLQKLKVILAVDRAGFVGEDGETHNGLFDVSMFGSVPGATVYAPVTYEEMRGFFADAIYRENGLVAVRYPRGVEPKLPEDFIPTYGAFDEYGDEDADVFIVTYGRIFANACCALDEIRKNGKRVKIIKLNRIKPIAQEVIEKLLAAREIYFFEEGIESGGVGEKTAALLLKNNYKGEYKLTAVPDEFVCQAPVESQIAKYHLDSRSIADIVMKAGELTERKNEA